MDVAFTRGPRGKLVFKRDAVTGAILMDSRAAYAVHVTIAAHKDGYYFDGEQFGTRLHTIKSDAHATGSRLAAAALDGIAQCKAEGLIFSGTASAEKMRTGRWRLVLDWQSPDGPQTKQEQSV